MRKWLTKAKEYLSGADAPTESDSERDGFLSYSAEWHALAIGAFLGVAHLYTGDPEIVGGAVAILLGKAKVSNSHLKDAAKEIAYSGGAFVIVSSLSLL